MGEEILFQKDEECNNGSQNVDVLKQYNSLKQNRIVIVVSHFGNQTIMQKLIVN